jgi:NAD(P)-dependent dehydrogenase (short-subunit alcohol dehydrogenase family)
MTAKNIAVIVTGAASGIGLAMTLGLMEAGHNVIAVDRNADGLAQLAKQAEGLKGSVHGVTADLAQPDSFRLRHGRCFDQIRAD